MNPQPDWTRKAGRRFWIRLPGSIRPGGITIILVSHSMEDVARYVQRIIVMNEGQKAFDGSCKEVFSHYKELEKIGLAAPQITYIMHALAERGLNVDLSAVTVEEARDSILKALGKETSCSEILP